MAKNTINVRKASNEMENKSERGKNMEKKNWKTLKIIKFRTLYRRLSTTEYDVVSSLVIFLVGKKNNSANAGKLSPLITFYIRKSTFALRST